MDPFYYEWTFCECEYGFYPDPIVTPQPPHCTPFPTDLFPEDLNGTFTDGDSGGRVRRGLDTQVRKKTLKKQKSAAKTPATPAPPSLRRPIRSDFSGTFWVARV